MSDDEMRVKIARHFGWTFPNRDQGIEMNLGHGSRRPDNHGRKSLIMWGTPPEAWGWAATNMEVPDYLNDLNVIREAVLSASLDGPTYLANLWKVCDLDRTSEFWTTANFANLMLVINATARQRCEAFIATVCPS